MTNDILKCYCVRVLAGPAVILVFIFSAVVLAIMSDLLYQHISR